MFAVNRSAAPPARRAMLIRAASHPHHRALELLVVQCLAPGTRKVGFPSLRPAQHEMVLRVAGLEGRADAERFERESGWRLVLESVDEFPNRPIQRAVAARGVKHGGHRIVAAHGDEDLRVLRRHPALERARRPRWLQTELLAPGSLVSMGWGPAQGLTRHDGKGLEIKVKRACATCNNGWMSRLEAAVKPVLVPLVRGQVHQLSYSEQQLVATWAVKTAMMLQFTPIHNTGPVIAPALYHELHAQPDQPPTRIAAWIGREVNQPPTGALFGLRGMSVEHVDLHGLVPVHGRYLGFEATMIARHLVLKVLGHGGPQRVRILKSVPAAPPGLDVIWPVQSSRGILLPQTG